MKTVKYEFPHSSFLSVEKDLNLITEKMLKNERLKKLLYYTSKDALSRENLTEDQSLSLIGNNIRVVPKMYVDGDVLNYIFIKFDNFMTNVRNPEFRNNTIEFDICCHFDQWDLTDFGLRPYKIAAELDSMLDQSHLTGIGKLDFSGATYVEFSQEFSGVCLTYRAIHGEEDKKFQPNPANEEQFLKEFDKIFNGITRE